MPMRILVELPPLYDEMVKVFPHIPAAKPIFAWRDVIYNPFDHKLNQNPQLIAHEEMHGMRQGKDDAACRMWWRDYLESPSFRLEEEIPAHRAEYRTLLRMHGNTRNNRRRFLVETATRMRNPLYGYNALFSMAQSKAWIELGKDEWQ